MGWNTGYTIFEETVIGAYDLGKLDEALLAVLMEPYRESDIDSGGSRDLLTKDGKGVEQVVLETLGLPVPAKPAEPELDWKRDASPAEEANFEAWDGYREALSEAFGRVTDERFGWR